MTKSINVVPSANVFTISGTVLINACNVKTSRVCLRKTQPAVRSLSIFPNSNLLLILVQILEKGTTKKHVWWWSRATKPWKYQLWLWFMRCCFVRKTRFNKITPIRSTSNNVILWVDWQTLNLQLTVKSLTVRRTINLGFYSKL